MILDCLRLNVEGTIEKFNIEICNIFQSIFVRNNILLYKHHISMRKKYQRNFFSFPEPCGKKLSRV